MRSITKQVADMDKGPSAADTPPDTLLARWQSIIDILAETGGVAAVLVVRPVDGHVEVMLSSRNAANRIPAGQRLPMDAGCYCDHVLGTGEPSQVRDARLDPHYATAMQLAGGLVSYIGYPLRRADGSLYGALCALDERPNAFAGLFGRQLELAVRATEAELASLEENARLHAEILAHRQTEQALRDTNRLHRTAQRIARLGHWHHDLRSNRLQWSEEMFELYGVDHAHFPASYDAFLDLIHPHDRQALADAFMRAVNETGKFRLRYRLPLPDGRVRWLEAQASVTRDNEGRPLHATGTTQDITVQVETEQTLRERERQLAEAQRLARLGSWHLDLATNELTWSDEIFRILEIERGAFAHSYESFLGFVHPDDRARLDDVYRRSVEERTEYVFEHRLLMPDGRIKWVIERGRTEYAGDGQPLHSWGTVQDITERRAQDRERDMLANIVRHSQELVNVATLDGRMVFLNDAGCRALGIEAADVGRHHVLDALPHEQVPYAESVLLPQLLSAGYWEGDLQYRNLATGEIRDFHAVCFKIANPETGEFTHIANVSLDITERARARIQQEELARQLQHTQKLESLGLMAGGMAHDFNNLLQAIMGNLELALTDLPAVHAARDSIDRSLLAARRAANITRQLLTFAGQDRGPVEAVDLRLAVEESLEMLRAAIDRRIGIHVLQGDDALPVRAVPGQLQQVVVNLVSNAADAMQDAPGNILVTCRVLQVAQERADTGDIGGPLPAGRYAVLEVRDEGCGMSADTAAHLFDPFFTTKTHGRGLGMPAVLGILRSSGGHINVRSRVGHGTTMRICWPLVAATPVQRPMPGNTAGRPLEGRHILVVDDEPTLRIVAAELLQRQGAGVTTAASGSEAIALARHASPPHDAVLLDITMPDMDGAETFRRLRELHPELPVLLSSGYDAPGAMARIGDARRTAFLAKPWQANALYRALDELLRQ